MTREEIITAVNSGADLSGVNLAGFDLRGANLNYAQLNGADLVRADLRNTNLFQANLRGTNLRAADLSGACLNYTDLDGADLESAVGIVCAGYDWRGYRFVGVEQLDVPWRVTAGCRWFTKEQGREHWLHKGNLDAIARLAVIDATLGSK